MATIEDLLTRQKQMWASCPDIVQTMILDKILLTIRAKIVREHGVPQDRRECFTDDWAAVAAKLESQSLTNLPRWTAPRSPTPINLCLGAHVDNQNHLQTTDTSFDYGTASAAGLLRYLDSDPLSPDNSPEGTVGLNSHRGVSPTPSHPLPLSQEILEPDLQKTVHSDPGAEEEGNGVRI